MILILENNIRCGIGSVTGDKFVKSNDNEKIVYEDAINIYRWAMSQSLLYDGINFETCICLDGIVNTPDANDNGYFLEGALRYPDNIKQKTKHFPFPPENKYRNTDVFNIFMNKIEPKYNKSHKNLVCDWTDKKN